MALQIQDHTQTAQEILAQASKKLNEAIKEVGPPNDFAVLLQELLEVSAKVAQFDEMASAAGEEASSEEAQTWKEISMMTLLHCRTQLVDRQRTLVEQLQGLSADGASLSKTAAPLTLTTDEAKVLPEAKGVDGVIGLPPGLPTPPGLAPLSIPTNSDAPKKMSPPGQWGPPGLNLPSGATGLGPPPGFQPENLKPKAQKAKQGDSSPKSRRKTKQQVKQAAVSAAIECGILAPVEPGPSMLNLDAYNSE